MAYERWTEEEMQVIRDMAPEASSAKIAKTINKLFNLERTSGSVRNRAGLLGISLGHKSGENQHAAKLSDKSVSMVRSLAACGYRLRDIHAFVKDQINMSSLHSIVHEVVRNVAISGPAEIIAKQEQEIRILKQQYHELLSYGGDLDIMLTEMVMITVSRIRTIHHSCENAFVYWHGKKKKFSILNGDKRDDEDLVGVYAKGCDIKILKEDLYEVLNEAYRGV